MKKPLSIALILSLLLTLLLPVVSAQENVDRSADTVPYDFSFDPSAVEIRDMSEVPELLTSVDSRGTLRHEQEDNLIFPGPLMKEHSVQPNQKQSFTTGIYRTGKADQYSVIMIYPGKEPTGEPVVTEIQLFDTNSNKLGLGSYTTTLYTTNMTPGRYTFVTCTAERKGDSLYPVDGTAFMTDIYCYNDYQHRWHIFAQDIETGEKLDVVRVWAEETKIIAMGRSPLPSDGHGSLSVTCPQELVSAVTAGGYIFLTPLRCGVGTLTITHRDNKIYNVPIFVCTAKDGHKSNLTSVALEPTVTEKGLNSSICTACGSFFREETPSLETSFNKFTDVPKDAWYYSSVQEAFYRRLFNGISDTQFKPTQAMNRAMLVTVLWRAEGSPEGAEPQFTDVPSTAWYYEAVNWAAENQIVNGVGKGKFNPLGEITREQMAAILYRYSQMIGLPAEAEESVSTFVDGDKVSSWAVDAMNWNIHYGMIGGVKQGNTLYLQPAGNATRAQVSAILVRFLNAFAEPTPEIGIPDISDAEASGQWGALQWAFYADGTLKIGGSGTMDDFTDLNARPWNAYSNRITAVEILYGVESVGAKAFENCTALQSVSMVSVSTLADRAFMGCTALTQVELSQNLTLIGESAFENCSALEHIDLPYGLRKIYDRAFALCTALKGIILPDSITGYDIGKASDYILEGIGAEAFYGCESLEYAYMPVAERRVPNRIFYGCTALKDLVLPLHVEYIGQSAFAYCSSLESVMIMTNLYELYIGAFAHCTSLKEAYVMSPYFVIKGGSGSLEFNEYNVPFGNPSKVKIYGIVGSRTESVASKYGYQFVDILSVVA